MEHSRKKIFHWKWEAKFHSQYLFVGSSSETEILQDLNMRRKRKILIWSTFGSIITYFGKKVCSKECSFLGTKILIVTFTY